MNQIKLLSKTLHADLKSCSFLPSRKCLRRPALSSNVPCPMTIVIYDSVKVLLNRDLIFGHEKESLISVLMQLETNWKQCVRNVFFVTF